MTVREEGFHFVPPSSTNHAKSHISPVEPTMAVWVFEHGPWHFVTIARPGPHILNITESAKPTHQN
jgi:hypothetical protein